jgi:survival-of-motor-neuron-related-splicing factor 30
MYRYDATIDSLTPNGYYVTYDGWGNKEEVWLLRYTG